MCIPSGAGRLALRLPALSVAGMAPRSSRLHAGSKALMSVFLDRYSASIVVKAPSVTSCLYLHA